MLLLPGSCNRLLARLSITATTGGIMGPSMRVWSFKVSKYAPDCLLDSLIFMKAFRQSRFAWRDMVPSTGTGELVPSLILILNVVERTR